MVLILTDEVNSLREATTNVRGAIVGNGNVHMTQAFPVHTGSRRRDVIVPRVGHI